MDYTLRYMNSFDWNSVRRIYEEGINTGNATFQTEIPTWEDWNDAHLKTCRFVACLGKDVVGWVALSPTSSRACYCGVVEVSVYIDSRFQNQGVGTRLLLKAIDCAEQNGIWCLYCSIIKENAGSIALHEKCGFRIIGFREKISKTKDGRWHDTILLERRSKKIAWPKV